MKIRELSAVAFGLIGLHTLALPFTTEELSRAIGVANGAAVDCGCQGSSGPEAVQETGVPLRSKSIIQSSLELQPIGGDDPQCQIDSSCTAQSWSWNLCLKVNNNPLQCQLWRRHFYRYFCPGENFHCCYDNWTQDEAGCGSAGLSCTSSNPTTLPSGCTPPIPGESTACSGC